MSTGSPLSDSGEYADTEEPKLCSFEEPVGSTVDTTPDSQMGIPDVVESTVKPTSVRGARIGDDLNNAAVLGEVRSSLSTISNGIEELATTVQDLFGLSESDSDSSEDYEWDAATGRRKLLPWGKLRRHARKRRRRRLQEKNATGSGLANAAGSESTCEEGFKQYSALIPDVRECNFEHFQSRPVGDDHCVDILIAGEDLDKEVREFRELLERIKSGAVEVWKPGPVLDRADDVRSQNEEDKWIRKIRINSRAVMDALQLLFPRLAGLGRRPGRPRVFHRPFQLLISLHPDLKELLAELNAAASADDNEEPELDASGWNATHSIYSDREKTIRNLAHDKNAIDQLGCFVDFMECRILPDARRYRDPSSPRPKTIRSEDLGYLFKPGDLVYAPQDTSGRDPFRSTPFSQPFLRVIQTAFERNLIPQPIGGSNERPWSVFGHFIEYDGTSYAPVHVASWSFARYLGQKKITELPIYPISYLEDDSLLNQAQLDGETYVNLIERRSGFYSGWTQTIDPLGIQIIENSPEGRRMGPEHIESDILVDFQETFNTIPTWKPKFYQPLVPDEGFADNLEDDNFGVIESDSIIEWDDAGRIKHDQFELWLDYDATEEFESKKFLHLDPLGQFRKATRKVPTGTFLALLPKRFFGYAVLERKFVQLSTRYVRSAELEANDKAFENLEIDRKYKQLILALVKSHFDKVETEKERNVEIESQDLIRGKGKGVVILLHGVPGVGKTATAEAVALKWKKPLFPITCGDLGYTAESLEKSLNEIFRLAHHWGCILLLDEADVFITQRERHDLKRNALVSAFLRVLEYYNGILFLTTNRAGVLDEAIKSRVHLNLYYDHLTEDQTVAIFKQHIQRLRNIEKQRNQDQNEQIMVLHKEILQFARDHFNHRSNSQGPGGNFGRWNGRQIRNAFLIASSLAHYDSEEECDEDKDELAEDGRKKQKQLGRSQFELVAQTTLMYDQYRQSVHSGKSDDHVAFEREERAISSQPRSPTPVRMKSPSMGFN